MMAAVSDFFDRPSEDFLDQCLREHLVKIAEHYEIVVGDKRLKENVKAILKANLFEMNILKPKPATVSVDGALGVQAPLALNFEQQKEMLQLRMQLEMEMERVKQQAD